MQCRCGRATSRPLAQLQHLVAVTKIVDTELIEIKKYREQIYKTKIKYSQCVSKYITKFIHLGKSKIADNLGGRNTSNVCLQNLGRITYASESICFSNKIILLDKNEVPFGITVIF